MSVWSPKKACNLVEISFQTIWCQGGLSKIVVCLQLYVFLDYDVMIQSPWYFIPTIIPDGWLQEYLVVCKQNE